MSHTSSSQRRALLVILDGWGLNKEYPGNAISLAKTPYFDSLWQNYPSAVFEASGESVGLPEGQMGTSEVNHFTIGAGRVEFQDLVRINKAISDDSFFHKPALKAAFDHVKKHHSALHVLGLVSDGGVHSHQSHVVAAVKAAAEAGVTQVWVHAITDGRDTSPRGGLHYLQWVEDQLTQIGVGRVASIVGRYYAMDRDHNWDRTDMAFKLLTHADGTPHSSAAKALEASYQAEITDEFVKPVSITPPGGEVATVKEHDALLFVNFRNDRPRQLTERLLKQGPKNLHLVTMTQYHPQYHVPVVFEPQTLGASLGQLVSEAGLQQLRVAETEKFPHVTFFLNCRREEPLEGEDRLMFDSYSDIPTHDLRPEMRTPQIAQALIENLNAGRYQLIITNLCNADMIGHTGNIPAAITGCETIDQALSQVIPVAQAQGYDIVITADHGNADEMIVEETGEPMTAHSLNPVPFIVISDRCKELNRKTGSMIDVAPTLLRLLELPQPDEMTGVSLVE